MFVKVALIIRTCLIIFAILCVFLIPTFISSYDMISSSNQLLLVQNFIYGKLIQHTTSS